MRQRERMIRTGATDEKETSKTYRSVLDAMATTPSGHCSDEKLEAYSSTSYDSGVKWKRDW